MTQRLIQHYNFRDLSSYSTFTHVLKGAEHLQLPLKSEESTFGESPPQKSKSMLRNKLLCAKPRNVLLYVGNKSHVQLGKMFSGLSVFQYGLNLLCAWEGSWQYTVPGYHVAEHWKLNAEVQNAMCYTKILTSLVSAGSSTLFL